MLNKTSVLVLTGFMGFAAVGNAVADLNDGLVAYYPFDGNAEDASGNENDGIERGSLNYVTGKIGQAAQFDGINNYVEVANSPSLELNRQLTISYIIAPQTQLIPAYPNWGRSISIVMKGRHTGNNYSSWIHGSLTGIAFQQYPIPPYNSVPRYTFSTLTSLVEGEFAYITMVRDNSKVKTYLNCTLLSEYEAHYDANERHGSLFIGYDGGYGYKKFKGILDDLRIYDRALSETEIQQLHAQKCEPLSVDIAGFSGKFDAQSTVLTWTALSEHLGFNIYRAELQDGKYANVTKLNNDLYSNQGESDEYTFIDDAVVAGKTYYYGLESFDFAGEVTQHKDDIISITTE